jgi:hypothetical protein
LGLEDALRFALTLESMKLRLKHLKCEIYWANNPFVIKVQTFQMSSVVTLATRKTSEVTKLFHLNKLCDKQASNRP